MVYKCFYISVKSEIPLNRQSSFFVTCFARAETIHVNIIFLNSFDFDTTNRIEKKRTLHKNIAILKFNFVFINGSKKILGMFNTVAINYYCTRTTSSSVRSSVGKCSPSSAVLPFRHFIVICITSTNSLQRF